MSRQHALVAGLAVLLAATGCAAREGAAKPATATHPTTASPQTPATPPVTAPTPVPTLSNAIRWSTASEVDNFGFDVYRGDAEEGPFTRLTPRPIAGAGTSDEPHAYKYVDDTIAAGKVYYYFVESISLAGVRERFTPVIRAAAKAPPASAPSAP